MQSKEAIRKWMVNYVARLVGMPANEIDPRTALADYGLDSTAAAGLSGDLSDWLGVHLEANLLKDHRSIDAVVSFVTTQAR